MVASMSKTEITIACADGQVLAASLFEPQNTNGLSLQINGATGVPRRYYDAFAACMAAQGFTVLTFDYRGIGGSQHTPGAPAPRMNDWGQQDCAGAQTWLNQHYPALTATLVCHSFGGQVLGLMPQAGRIAAAVLVASQHGYWRNWAMRYQMRLVPVWYLFVPLVLALRLRAPSALFGGEPLPHGVLSDWSRWCRSPHYVCDEKGRAWRPHNDAVRARIRMVSIDDDHDFGPKRGVDALQSYYPNARIERQHVVPADWGLPRIGHFGFFRREMPVEHWTDIATWLVQAATCKDEKAA